MDTRLGILDTTLEFTYNEELKSETFSCSGKTEGFTDDQDSLLTKAGRYTLIRDPENEILRA